MMKRNQKGFSLIELLIVVAIILIIAAIAIPNLLRSKMSANEAAAVGSMRLLITCSIGFLTGHPDIGFPTNMTQLAPIAVGGMDGCIDEVLAGAATGGAPKSGYVFVYVPTLVAGINATFTLNGDPPMISCERTGIRTYFSDDSGVLRFKNTPGCPPADVLDPPI